MQPRSGSQIREDFLRFFESKGHRRVHSSSLVPANDPTLLFTNAGMNQFKDVFLGAEQRPYTRAVSSQKCVRAGGKHNDLENVGFTRRHHTFFEMLGNFSFGDYFKREAIAYAWELLTSPDWFGIDPTRLYVTIFEGDNSAGGNGTAVPRDAEAYDLWLEAGVPAERIFELGAKDNFWAMGDTGPCGPCSEIYFDLGIEASETGTDLPFGHDDQRYMEIWNLVFMQFDRSSDGVLSPLPKPSIDTGMGLERIACVLQSVLSNYQTDLFTPLIQRAAELCLPQNALGAPSLALSTKGGVSSEARPLSSNPTKDVRHGDPEQREGEEPLYLSSAEAAISPDKSAAELCLPQNALGAPSLALSTKGGVSSEARPLSSNPTKDVRHGDPEQREGEEPLYLSSAEAAISPDKSAASLRIIADHARAATFLISDGVQPANEGRGYVLRKILRRAIRHGRLLGQAQPFMHEMAFAVTDQMKVAYPELGETADRVSKIVLAEEKQFDRILGPGMRAVEHEVRWPARQSEAVAINCRMDNPKVAELVGRTVAARQPLTGEAFHRELKEAVGLDDFANFIKETDLGKGITWVKFSGKKAFDLYQTYGVPVDFIVDVARDAGLLFDWEGFEAAKAEEQARARASWRGGSQKSASPAFRDLAKTEFEGYTALRVDGARILALVKDGVGIPSLQPGESGEAVLDATSFYADSGGQVGDTGWLYSSDHQSIAAEVTGCTKPVQGVFAHKVTARQPLLVGAYIDTVVNGEVRAATMRNHTGTHLLHAALREVLGTHVKQAGSLVDQSRLRFDFSHFTGIAEPELREIESLVNQQVLANTPVQTLVDIPIDIAVNDYGAMALFGEKYGDKVRVVKIGDFSTELCGGTHTRATGEIGLLKIVGESSVASGVRRVEAISGTSSLEEFRHDFAVARVVPGGEAALRAKLAEDEAEIKKLRRELDSLRLKAAAASVSDSESSAVDVNGVKVLAQRVDGVEKNQMRELIDQLRTRLGSGVVVLGSAGRPEDGGKVTLIVGVTKDLTSRVHAGKLVGALAALVGGRGGGRPDLAEAGGSDPSALDSALAQTPKLIRDLIG